ncbi:MAG: M15 family metallopeptidase [Bacteroidota bacterium]
MDLDSSCKTYCYLIAILICFQGCAVSNNPEGEQLAETSMPPTSALSVEKEPEDTVSLAYLLGKFDPSQRPEFVKLQAPIAGGNAVGRYMHEEAFEAYLKMYAAAAEEGISLVILSATRNFDAQKSIWESKWTGKRLVGGVNLQQTLSNPMDRAKEILLYSSMPGTSRHHWGTDIDLNSFNNAYFKSGDGKKVYDWLTKHAQEFGFCQPYTDKSLNGRSGYEEERWHWSYMPLSKGLLRAYRAKVSYEHIGGFLGAEAAQPLSVIQQYVEGVNAECK